jgi:hypothetical protein
MSNLGNAYALATALYARDKSKPIEEIAEHIYDVVDGLDFGSDERKADLYSQLAESLDQTTKFSDAVIITEVAMDSTDRRYPHG